MTPGPGSTPSEAAATQPHAGASDPSAAVAPGASENGAVSPPVDDLAATVRTSLGWSLASQLAARLLTMASTVVLLRLVAPGDYGAYVFALAAVTMAMSVNDVGQAVAVARWPAGGLAEVARTGTTLAWGASVVVFAGCLVAAGPISRLGGTPASAAMIRVLSVLVVVDGLTAVPRGLLLRAFHYRALAVSDVVGVVANAAGTLGALAAGAGMWAPVVGTLTGAAVSAAVVLGAAPDRPRPGWDAGVAVAALAFGTPMAATLLVELALLNVDYLVVGNRLGPEGLGLYSVAFSVASWPATLFTHGIRRVSVSGFAALEDRRTGLAAAFGRSVSVLVTLLLPCCVGLAVVAEPLLRILYGSAFAPVAPALSWLVVLAAVRVLTGLVHDVVLAEGCSRTTVLLQVMWLVVVTPALLVGARLGGPTGVAAAHALVGVAVALPIHAVAIRRLGVDGALLARGLARPVVGAGAALAVGSGAVALLDDPWVEGAVGGTLVLVAYAAVAVPRGALRRARSTRSAPLGGRAGRCGGRGAVRRPSGGPR